MFHYENLRLYLRPGLKLKKIHRIIELHQSQWLKPYIEFNTKKWRQEKNGDGKMLHKLMNNAIY